MADLNTLKNWFKNGLKPTQEQFWQWMDSYWHKDEKIPLNNIENIEGLMDSKADKEAFEGHLIDEDAHGLVQKLANKVDLADFQFHLEDESSHNMVEKLAAKVDLEQFGAHLDHENAHGISEIRSILANKLNRNGDNLELAKGTTTRPPLIIPNSILTTVPINGAIERDSLGRLHTTHLGERYQLLENESNIPIKYSKDLSKDYTLRSIPDLEHISSIAGGYLLYRKPPAISTVAYVKNKNTSSVLYSPDLKIRGLKKTTTPTYPYMTAKLSVLLGVYRLEYETNTSKVPPISCKYEIQLVPSNPDLIRLKVGAVKESYVTVLSGEMSTLNEDVFSFETAIDSRRVDKKVRYRQLVVDPSLDLKTVALNSFTLVEKDGSKSFALDWNSDDYGLNCRVMIKIDYLDEQNTEGKNATTSNFTTTNIAGINSLSLIDIL